MATIKSPTFIPAISAGFPWLTPITLRPVSDTPPTSGIMPNFTLILGVRDDEIERVLDFEKVNVWGMLASS